MRTVVALFLAATVGTALLAACTACTSECCSAPIHGFCDAPISDAADEPGRFDDAAFADASDVAPGG